MAQKQGKEIRQESIIQAAIDEFLEKGYEGASMNGIANRAKVSKGGVYHHFTSKEQLLMESNRKLCEPIVKMAEQALSMEARKGLVEYVISYLTYWIQRPNELSFFFLSMSKMQESKMLMEYYQEYNRATTAFYIQLFQRIKEEGQPVNDPEIAGITLMGALDGCLTYALAEEIVDIENFANRILKIWL